jgi:hypothetical protein
MKNNIYIYIYIYMENFLEVGEEPQTPHNIEND